MSIHRSRPPTRVTGTSQSQTRPRRQPAKEDLDDIEEDEIHISKPVTGPIRRNTYQPPKNYDTPLMRMFRDYLNKTGLESNFRCLLHRLMDRPNLPYNPYPGLAKKLRKYAEKDHMEIDRSPDEIYNLLKNSIEETLVPHLYTIQGYSGVWGLSNILQAINPSVVVKYCWLVDSITPAPEDMINLEGYTNQLAIALIGPTVFEGTLYPLSFNIQFRMEYLVTGQDVTQAFAIFVNTVMSEIDALSSHHYHRMLGVNLPIAGSTELEFWNPERIQEEKEEFIQALSDTVIAQEYIYVECVFRTDPEYPVYKRGQKQYALTFIEVEDDIREEGYVYSERLNFFSKYPLASLHEGIFLNFSHAEIYTSAFIPPMEQLEDAPNTVRQTGRTAPTRRRSQLNTVRTTGTHQMLEYHVHNPLHHIKPKKVRIDGFRVGVEEKSGPYSWQITTPIKGFYEIKMAGYHPQAELLDIIYAAIIINFLDSEAFESEFLIEIFHILHGAAGRLYLLMEQNKGLRAIIQAFSATQDTSLMREQISVFKEAVKSLFQNNLQERSGEQIVLGRVIVGKLEETLLLLSNDRFTSWRQIQEVQKTLKNINWYCLTLLIQLAEDSLQWCPIFTQLINTVRQTFSDDVLRPVTKIRAVRPKPKGQVKPTMSSAEYKHGYEDDHIMKHDRFKLNVDECVANGNTPQSIAKETVLVKYMLEIHIDQVWNDLLLELAGGQFIPPNPYPRVSTRMRQCSARMDLCYEKSSVLLERILTNKTKIKNPQNFVYHVPGVDAFGCRSALMLLDVGPFLSVLDIAKQFMQLNYIHRKGPYKIGICLAVSGPCIWYGKMQPYLNEVELHEHYYIQGPPGCAVEAMKLCGLMVNNHILELVIKGTIPVAGVYFGRDTVRWNWEKIVNDRGGFAEEFSDVCSKKESIYMKAYTVIDNWRYVLVKKYFMLHFLTDDNTDACCFYSSYKPDFYQSLFLTEDRAAFHYQNGGGFHGTSPMNAANAQEVMIDLHKKMAVAENVCDWITFHRCLLLQSLILEDSTHIVNAWRMLHSRACVVEYLISLTESLQNLAGIGIEYKIYQHKRAKEAELELMMNRPVLESKKEAKARKKEERAKTKAATRQGKPPVEPGPADDLRKPEYVNPVNDEVLGMMTVGYLHKLLDTCDTPSFLSAQALSDFFETKLRSVMEKDPYSGQLYIASEEQAHYRLTETRNMLRMLQDSLAGDVHSICPEASDVIDPTHWQEVVTERSYSVLSDDLDDPTQYRPKPLQMKTIME